MNVFTVLHFVKRFLWDHSVFTQYSYYSELFCLEPASRLSNRHRHVWVRYINNTKNMVVCMSSMLLYIDLQRFCYFIMLYFKLNNGAMVKWWMVKWCIGEINNGTGRFFSHRYWICSFVLFSNTPFSQQTKQFVILNSWSLTTSTATKFVHKFSNKEQTNFDLVLQNLIICCFFSKCLDWIQLC